MRIEQKQASTERTHSTCVLCVCANAKTICCGWTASNAPAWQALHLFICNFFFVAPVAGGSAGSYGARKAMHTACRAHTSHTIIYTRIWSHLPKQTNCVK